MPRAAPTHKPRRLKGVRQHRAGPPKDKTYDKSKWRYGLRVKMLKQYPYCMICKVRPSEHVDHIIALRAGGANSMDNLQALCASCHSKKTAKFDRGRTVGGG